MITARDLEYHHGPDDDHRWTETYFLPISVPEEHLLVTVYVVVRPTLGVMANDVIAYGSLTDTRSELLYIDSQQHLVAPERFSSIHSSNGLVVTAVDAPRRYRIDYVGYDNTEIHVDWEGIMDPFDMHDPQQSPHAAVGVDAQADSTGMGEAYKGHFDMTGRVTGTVKVRGREFPVDVIDRMDHSWGPRHELEFKHMNSINAEFGPDLAFHINTKIDPDAPTGQDQTLAHGYVLDGEEVRGIADMDLVTIRVGIVPVSMTMRVTDVSGKVFALQATADIGAPWASYPSNVTWMSQMRWQCGDRVGKGVVQEHHPLPKVTARRGRWWTDGPSAIST